MPLSSVPGLMWPGQRISAGTRKAPSQLVFFSDRNGVVPASGQLFIINPLAGRGADNLFSTHPATHNRIEALLRLATVWNIPVATNRSTADFLIDSPLFKNEVEIAIPDYQRYLQDRLK